MCVTLREGRYYLGAEPGDSRVHSRVGAIHLSPADSNLLIRSYPSETATLSAGILLPPLTWQTHRQTAAGAVMKAVIPDDVALSLSTVNELYTDGVAAVRAKYPNGNPYYHGLYSTPTGYIDSAASWLPPRPTPNATLLRIDTPSRNHTIFQYYELGIGGTAAAFDPPTNLWAIQTPRNRSLYSVPSGLVATGDVQQRAAQWGQGEGGLVHAMHHYQWGSWVFDMAGVAVNKTAAVVQFGRGGFQEARGNLLGGQYYVSNLLAELDAPNEWYIDPSTRMLYFMANGSMPHTFVLGQRSCLLSVVGSQSQPVQNVTLSGLEFTETANTLMESYEAPASGDWAIHRGGAVFLHGTENVVVEQSLFHQLASNALVVSDWNLNVSIDSNEFVWLGDSAVLIIGTSTLIDGVSNREQPDVVTVSHNLIHETGAYVKQSAPVFIGLSRQVLVTANLMFNVPRSCVNINDGFAGNKTVSYNVTHLYTPRQQHDTYAAAPCPTMADTPFPCPLLSLR